MSDEQRGDEEGVVLDGDREAERGAEGEAPGGGDEGAAVGEDDREGGARDGDVEAVQAGVEPHARERDEPAGGEQAGEQAAAEGGAGEEEEGDAEAGEELGG
jgi:hypothetical protein